MSKKNKEFVREVTPQSEDYSQWYLDLILKTEMVDYAPVKGCMVIRPYGYTLWENMQALLDKRFKKTGHKNAYFPLLIPESLLQKEAEHVKGFAPEVAWVTHGGSEKLAERLVIRPTSETIICSMYSKWIQSWRDLPVLINQWCNVVRWEKTTRPFLRTSEFLWQEGHTAHIDEEDAERETLQMLGVYKDFVETELAIPVVSGQKTDIERFAGALRTYTIETLMSDGKALQSGTSHNLGDHFAKVFDIKYLDKDDQLKNAHTTSWGVSTRLIGAIVMVHGDDRGLKLPPKVAPTQVVIVPIIAKKQQETVLAKSKEIYELLEDDFRLELDDRDGYSAGWKYNEWEMKGVPLRLEIGPKDIEKNQVVLVRRDTGEKIFAPLENIKDTIDKVLKDIQSNMFNMALKMREENTHFVDDYEEFKKVLEEKRGFIVSPWCGDSFCEEQVKAETKATIRCIPFEGSEVKEDAQCLCCKEAAKYNVYFAKSY